MANYYVRKDGDDSNAGTSDTSGGAWLTLTKMKTFALAASPGFVSGDTITVDDGVYTDKYSTGWGVLIGGSGTWGGASGNPVTLRAKNRGMVVVNALEDGNNNPRVDGVSGSAQAARVFGMYLYSLNWWVIEGFKIIDAYGTSVYMDGCSNVIFQKNEIAYGGWASDLAGGHSGLYIKQDCANITARKNIIHNCGTTRRSVRGHGIYAQNPTFHISNNILVYNRGWGLQIAPNTTNISSAKVFHNVAAYNGSTGTGPYGENGVSKGSGIILNSASAQVNELDIRNNTLAYNREYGIAAFEANSNNANNVVNNNHHHGNTSGSYAETGAGSIDLTPTNWVTGDPLFTAPASLNFVPQTGSPLIDAGVDLFTSAGVADDIEDRTRPYNSVADIGAYEISGSVGFTRFNRVGFDLANGVHNFGSHTLRIMLSNTLPNVSNSVKADITEIAATNGYDAGGKALTLLRNSETDGVYWLATSDPATWQASGGAIGPFRYAVLYNDTQTSPSKPLIGWWDIGSVTLNAGQTFLLDLDQTLGILSIV